MVKKSTTMMTTSQPVPVQEIKREELEKVVKQVDLPNVDLPKTIDPEKKKKRSSSKVKQVETPVIVEPEVITKLEEPTIIEENVEVIEENVVEEPVLESENMTDDSKDKKRNRRIISKENYYKDFESFLEIFNNFVENCKTEKGTKNQKTGLMKKLKQLQNDSYKLLKIKYMRDDKKPKSENNSGFMKPIKISSDLAQFLETDPNEPITRVHVTKKLCQYIKEKDLQNPQDRREIVPDNKLKNLFNMGDEKLTYYSMQKHIQQHIFKV